MMRIAHIAAEGLPFSKTGGLADVLGALPPALAARGHRVVVILPCHRPDPRKPAPGEAVGPPIEAGGFLFDVRRAAVGDVTFLLMDSPRLFARPFPYGTPDGEYPDNPVRFAAFARAAVIAAAREMPGLHVLHLHDWQAAVIAGLLGRDPALGGALQGTPTVLTIHNLAYQGSFEPWAVQAAHLPWQLFQPDGFEFWGRVNFLKGGMLFADRLTTVSPTYAREILEPDRGEGLHEILWARQNELKGILNGLDTEAWSPVADPFLPERYTPATVTRAKRRARAAVAEELGLEADDSPMVGVVSRLVHQKGADLLASAVHGLAGFGYRVALLGSGDARLEQEVADAVAAHPGRAALRRAFDEPLAHRIYAGADLFLMPSRYEPCGLSQLIALTYGALPVVNPTGGLADTVFDLDADPEAGNGFHLSELTPGGIVEAAARARTVLTDASRLLALRRRVMVEDRGWSPAAAAYEKLYEEVSGPR
jgi:starch synthase